MKTKKADVILMVIVTILLFGGLALMLSTVCSELNSVSAWFRIISGAGLLFGTLIVMYMLAIKEIEKRAAEQRRHIDEITSDVVSYRLSKETVAYFEENLPEDVVDHITGDIIHLNIKPMLAICFKEGRECRKRKRKEKSVATS